jgi:hypothetical protein
VCAWLVGGVSVVCIERVDWCAVRVCIWALSSNGRAPASHAGGRGIDTPSVHFLPDKHFLRYATILFTDHHFAASFLASTTTSSRLTEPAGQSTMVAARIRSRPVWSGVPEIARNWHTNEQENNTDCVIGTIASEARARDGNAWSVGVVSS